MLNENISQEYKCNLCDYNTNNRYALAGHLGNHKSQKILKAKVQEKKAKYLKNPSICILCNGPIKMTNMNGKYCSHSCAAKDSQLGHFWISNGIKEYKISKNSVIPDGYIKARIQSYKRKTEPKPSKRKSIRFNKAPVQRKDYCIFSYCVECNKTIKHKHLKTCGDECYKKLLSRHAYNRDDFGGNRNKRSKGIWYSCLDGSKVYLESSWEITLAKLLDTNQIHWIRPKPLEYIGLDEKKHRYFPDFYLPKYDVYLDPKNPYLRGLEETKHKISYCKKQYAIEIYLLDISDINYDNIMVLLENSAISTCRLQGGCSASELQQP